MFYHYLKITWRSLNRHKLFSLINIFGLASGMTVCMLAMMKIKEAYDYDNFHPNAASSYRIVTNLSRKNGEHFLCASSPLPLAGYLKQGYAAIDKSTAVYFSFTNLTGNAKSLPLKAAYVDADFYRLFGFTLLTGAPAVKPQSVVLTKETAERFFGKNNPVGQVVTIGDSARFTVSGVLATPSAPSHLEFDVLAAVAALPMLQPSGTWLDWSNEAAAYTYVQVKPGVTKENLHKILQNASLQASKAIPPSANKRLVFDMQALQDISPGTRAMYNITAEPIMPNIIAFAAIGFAMLLLAFFNYINLTLARSLDRAREVGVRKVTGALRQHLVVQFLSESVVVAVLAFGLAYLQLRLVSSLPTVDRLIGHIHQDIRLWIYFVLFTLFTGVVAGWIPASVLSGFQPVRVLKGKFDARLFGGAGLRKTLTVVQFAASLVAIVMLLVFYRQSVYMATADYGFKREHIINITLPANGYDRAAVAVAAIPGVERISATSGLFGFSGGDTRFVKSSPAGDSLAAAYFAVTPSFIPVMGLQLVAGNPLAAIRPNNSIQHVLVNEAACKQLRFANPADAVGKSIWINDSTICTIDGVVKDFHYASFLRSIQPLILANNPAGLKTLNLQISRGAEQQIVASLRTTWKQLYPLQPFDGDWFDKALYDQHLHKDDLVFMGLLTAMALSIACFGLLGIVMYTTKNRSKRSEHPQDYGCGDRAGDRRDVQRVCTPVAAGCLHRFARRLYSR